MKIPLSLRFIENPAIYYALRAGVLPRARIVLKTSPDKVVVDMDAASMQRSKALLKALLKAVQAGRILYHASTGKMTLVSGDGKRKEQCPFDLSAVETILYCLDNNILFEACADQRFLIAHFSSQMKFYVRKDCCPDVQVIQASCLQDEYAFLYPYLKDSVVVDVGANIADTAVFFCRKGARRVVGFEPHPGMYEQAVKNVALNALSHCVDLYNEGVGALEGSFVMKEDNDLGATAGFGLKESSCGRAINVKVRPMGAIIDQLGHIDVLKMDCEGAEFDIIPAMSLDELKKIRVIGMEYHRDPEVLIAKLEAAGFDVTIVKAYSDKIGLLLAVGA